jgi:outer membrane usher protein
MRVVAVLAVTMALLQIAAEAAAEPPGFTEYVIELRVNGQQADSALVVRRDAAGSLLVRAEDLARLRLSLPDDARIEIEGVAYYRVGPEQGAQVTFDSAALVADVMLPPEAFDPTHASYQAGVAPTVAQSNPGGFLNYDASIEQSGTVSSAGALVELGFYGAHGVVTQTTAGRVGEGHSGTVRLETTWTRDMPDRVATLRVGDAISMPGAWGRAVRFGGIQFGTNFGTRPALITTPLLAASGEAVVPSTVDVFINGRQVANESVPPGPFTIDGLPAISGAGQMQVVVTDALGRQQVVSQPYYSGASLLSAGLDEYSFEFGSIRRNYAVHSSDYGDMLMAGTFRRGVTDYLTVEAHAEAQGSGARAAGVDVAWQAGATGVLTSTLAVGLDDSRTGWLGGLGFEHSGQRVSLFARTQYTSGDFVQLGDSVLIDRPKLRGFLSAALNLQRLGSAQLVYGRQSYWDAPQVQTLGLSYSLTLGRAGFLSLYASRSLSGDDRSDVMLNWTLPFGERRSMTASAESGSGRDIGSHSRANVALQQNLPAGSGSGYYLSASTDQLHHAGYAYQGRSGLAEIEYGRRGPDDGWRAGAVGGLTLTAAGLMPARRLDRSFAVVRVADYEGLTVFVDNQPVGKTDKKGRVLIGGLRPYESNEISLDPAEIPMDATLSEASMTLTPAYRSGPVVQFPVSRSSGVVLHLVLHDGSVVPAGASVVIQDRSFPVGMDGLAYLADTGGASRAIASWSGGQCSFELQRPAGEDPIPDLGRVSCFPSTPGVSPQ